jgi:hypothetical protein
MIGSPCNTGTSQAGTVKVSYTPQGNGTDTISWVCAEDNPTYALNLSILADQGQVCHLSQFGQEVCTSGYGSIEVTASPGAIDCQTFHNSFNSGTCTDSFSPGTVVTLTAAGYPGTLNTQVGSWLGCNSVSADGLTCTVTVNGLRNVSVRAIFTG